jgi:hypothetical protein
MIWWLAWTRGRPNPDVSVGAHDNARPADNSTRDQLKLTERVKGVSDVTSSSAITVEYDYCRSPVGRYAPVVKKIPIERDQRALLSPSKRGLVAI